MEELNSLNFKKKIQNVLNKNNKSDESDESDENNENDKNTFLFKQNKENENLKNLTFDKPKISSRKYQTMENKNTNTNNNIPEVNLFTELTEKINLFILYSKSSNFNNVINYNMKLSICEDLNNNDFIKNTNIYKYYCTTLIFRQFLIFYNYFFLKNNTKFQLNNNEYIIFQNFYKLMNISIEFQQYSKKYGDFDDFINEDKTLLLMNNKDEISMIFDNDFINKFYTENKNLNSSDKRFSYCVEGMTLNLALVKNPLKLIENERIYNSSFENKPIIYKWEDGLLNLYQVSINNSHRVPILDLNDLNLCNTDENKCVLFKSACLNDFGYNNDTTIDKKCIDIINDKGNEELMTEIIKEVENKENTSIYHLYRLLKNLGFTESFNNETLLFDINNEQNKNILKLIENKQLKNKIENKYFAMINEKLKTIFNKMKNNEQNKLNELQIRENNRKNQKRYFISNNNINRVIIDEDKYIELCHTFKEQLSNELKKNNKKLGNNTSELLKSIVNTISNLLLEIKNNNMVTQQTLFLNSYTDGGVFLDENLKTFISEYVKEQKQKLQNHMDDNSTVQNTIITKLSNNNIVDTISIKTLQQLMLLMSNVRF